MYLDRCDVAGSGTEEARGYEANGRAADDQDHQGEDRGPDGPRPGSLSERVAIG